MKKFILLIACMILTACGPRLQPLGDLRATNLLDIKAQGKAVMVFSGSYSIVGMLGRRESDISLQFAKGDKPKIEDIVGGVQSHAGDTAEHPTVRLVDAGRYQLISFIKISGPGAAIMNNSGAFTGVSLGEVSVGPGEVVYVGNVVVKAEKQLLGISTPSAFSLNVRDESTRARSYLQGVTPALASEMTTRLVTVNSIFQTR